jgi:hypothetical protein
MSRLELPLESRILRVTGDRVLYAELKVSIKTNQGIWLPVDFRVDSGTEMTTMLAARAKKWDLPIPKKPVWGVTPARAGGATGADSSPN